MKSLFSPAIALMNRMGYTKKFVLLWLVALAAVVVMICSLFIHLNEEIVILRRELEGIAQIKPISQSVQTIQRHRRRWVVASNGSDAMQKNATIEAEAAKAFDALEGKLPSNLRATEGWRNIKANWENLEKEESGMTADGSFSAHTRLIGQLLFFETATADEYALTTDPQIDTYYLIDTAINKLPSVLEHIGQLRAYGAGILTSKQITETQKINIYKVIGMLDDALEASAVSLEKTGRYNPAVQKSLSATSGVISDAAHRVVSLMESDILAGRLATTPEDFIAITTSAIDDGYTQLYQLLLPATETLLKERLARAESVLQISIGAALLLILVVAYFAVGIYYSITGSVLSLARSARAFAGGDMSERVRLDTRDELGQLGDSFNEMADGFNAMHKQLRDSHDDLGRLLNSMVEGMCGVDPDGNITFVNQSFLQLMGYQHDNEVLGKNLHELIHHSHADGSPYPASECKIYRAFQTNQIANAADEVFWRKDGVAIPVEYWAHPVVAGGVATGSIVTFVDITERVLAEKKLQKYSEDLAEVNRQLQDTHNHLMQSEKMASIGQLAAGVAHEINNPIGYVYSNLGTLEKYVRDTFGMIDLYERAEGAITDPEIHAKLTAARVKLDIEFLKEDLRALMEESKDGITRVKNIVQNLKDFSHVDAADEWHFADLHNGLNSTLNIVNNEIKYKASVVKEYGDIPEVECLHSQLNQVFMNLLVNAAHAIEERGTITIRTGRQGEEVWVEVADTGKGIAPEHLKKIFDPFFTTKPIGKGTGLGLSLAYGIVQKHHGRIEVQSEVGKGTAFRVWLPVRHTDNPTPDVNGGSALLPNLPNAQDFSI